MSVSLPSVFRGARMFLNHPPHCSSMTRQCKVVLFFLGVLGATPPKVARAALPRGISLSHNNDERLYRRLRAADLEGKKMQLVWKNSSARYGVDGH